METINLYNPSYKPASIIFPLAGDINWMETKEEVKEEVKEYYNSHSLGILIEWKLQNTGQVR